MKILSSLDAYHYLRDVLTADVEEFWAVALSSEKDVLSARCLFRGTVDACHIHPRDIFRFAVLINCSAILVAHNHPSENCLPSKADEKVTRNLLNASRMMQIPIIDHIILSKNSYWSFADKQEFCLH